MPTGTITLYLAISLDGYVADADGGVDWLEAYDSDPDAPGSAAVAYESFFASVDALVMGSTTYEQVLEFGAWPYGEKPTVVVTSRDLPRATDEIEFVGLDDDEDLRRLAERLRGDYDHVWHVGGATLARAFLEEGLVDDIRLTIVPELLGDGISLFADGSTPHSLDHGETNTFENGLVELCYSVEN